MACQRVAVLGASPKAGRFSNRAVKALAAHGHEVIPVNPAYPEVEGLSTFPDLFAVKGPVDTLSVYIAPERIVPHIPGIIALRPGRVILNPGTESPLLMEALDNAGIPCVTQCTLVMLSSGKF